MTKVLKMRREYSGFLVGGPSDGETVTTYLEKIPFDGILRLWLSGRGEDKTANEVQLRGHYIWNERLHMFEWNLEDAAFFTRKPVAA